MTKANTILKQLGGNRFLAMTGAVCIDVGTGLQIKLPRISKLSCVRIELEVDDTYTVTGYKGRGVRIAPAAAPVSMVYADNLRRLFTSLTGLEVTL